MEEAREEIPQDVVPQAEQSWISNAPWWLISVGIHVVIVLAMTLFVIEHTVAVDEGEVMVMVQPKADAKIAELEPPRDVFTRVGLPKPDEQAASPTEEPSIFFPEAKDSDHNESADNEEFHQMKGDSKDFLSYVPGEAGGFRGRQNGPNKGVYDTIGVGGGSGSGGRYGGRYGGKENLRAKGGGTTATDSAVLQALKWLARHQNPDGSWSAAGFSNQCCGAKCAGAGDTFYDAGVTGLSLLAFLGAGYSHLSKDEFPDPACPGKMLRFGEVVKKAIQWCTSHQDQAGCLGPRDGHYMYNHAICSLALSEAYGMTGAQILKDPAQRAIDFVVSAQNPGKGWRYSEKSGDNDSSVTGWCVMALKSAELSELGFPRACYDGALAWYKEITDDRGYYRVGYDRLNSGKVYLPGKNEDFDDHQAMSAVAVMARIFIQKRKNEPALGSVTLLASDLPEWKPKRVDYYYWYYASLALFQYDGPDGGMWRKWNEPMKNALVPNQKTRKDGCADGSWDTEIDRWSCEGGRVYATAINALTLEVYYRYQNVFNPGAKK